MLMHERVKIDQTQLDPWVDPIRGQLWHEEKDKKHLKHSKWCYWPEYLDAAINL